MNGLLCFESGVTLSFFISDSDPSIKELSIVVGEMGAEISLKSYQGFNFEVKYLRILLRCCVTKY